MAFGFSVGDFLAVLEIAKGVYDACKDGSAEYKELCSETKSMRYAIQSLSNDARDPDSLLNRKGFNRKNELDQKLYQGYERDASLSQQAQQIKR